jgi:imidazole glycerol-phosphate synthase subunit HisF
MLKTRIIPVLLLREDALVKTVKFNKPGYIGDPINTVRIFNELEVDELVFLDIEATPKRRLPNLKILREIADECFMPLAYGGGIKDFKTAAEIFEIGFEKIVVNTACHTHPQVVGEIARHFGNQAVVASVDVKKNFWGNYEVWTSSASQNTKKNPVDWCKQLEKMGAGEILLTSVDREGTWSGYDIDLTLKVGEAVTVPVIAHGGAGDIEHIINVVQDGKASAVALGSMVVYQQKGMGVLVNFPENLPSNLDL